MTLEHDIVFQNPFEDVTISKMADPCILIIFGATGDLTARKLLPALYNLYLEGRLPSHFCCVGFARREKTHEQFRLEMQAAITQHSRTLPIKEEIFRPFSEQLFYFKSEFDDDKGYEAFQKELSLLDTRFGTQGNRIYYLATPPSYFPSIISKLKAHNMLYDATSNKFSRVVIEKPFGHDVQNATLLQSHLNELLTESQTYRIDHYLGKETVQNLLVLRFGNPIFESVWNNRYIDHVQITVSEDQGVGTRGRFYEEAGVLRDIVQNHMMQLISLVAMEPPVNLHADSIRDEKVKVLEAIRPFTHESIDRSTVRGQYSSGFIHGEPVHGYRQEENVSPSSITETFVALEFFIDNWRWSQVPFFLRTGKRLPKRATEIAIFFKEPPAILFRSSLEHSYNTLVIRIQPDEGISLKFNTKVPGISFIHPVKMDFRYGSYFGATPPEAYERLLCDCMLGDQTLFARQDEVLYSWNIIQPILDHWKETHPHDFPNYAAGTWGPEQANHLIEREGRRWRLI